MSTKTKIVENFTPVRGKSTTEPRKSLYEFHRLDKADTSKAIFVSAPTEFEKDRVATAAYSYARKVGATFHTQRDPKGIYIYRSK